MNLLQRTRRLLQGLTPPPLAKAQHYSVTCPDGHRLRGERTEGYQALRCPTCGEGIFVLPRSPLPMPADGEAKRPARKPMEFEPRPHQSDPVELVDPLPGQAVVEDVGADLEEAEIEWLDAPPQDAERATVPPAGDPDSETAPNAPQSRKDRGPTRRSPKSAEPGSATSSDRPRTATSGRRAAPTSPAIDEVAAASTPRERLAEWASARRNLLIFAGVALVLVGTVAIRTWRSRFRDLPRIAELGRTEGLVALDAGRFDTAHQRLSQARRAVEALGNAFEGADEIIQGAKEAAIFSNLVPDSLEIVLAQASPDPDEWNSRFKTLYKGRSIIIDAHIIAVPSGKGSGEYELDYRILPAGDGAKPRVGRIDLTGFELFEYPGRNVGDRVIFGARLASFSLDRDSDEWVVGLESDSGVYIQHPKALEAIGWPAGSDSEPEKAP